MYMIILNYEDLCLCIIMYVWVHTMKNISGYVKLKVTYSQRTLIFKDFNFCLTLKIISLKIFSKNQQ